jgi:ABC-2 type transport system ATP-binding protein
MLRGVDIEQDPVAAKEQIGVVPEESNLYPELTSRRNLEYIGELYGLSRSVRRSRAGELLEVFDLTSQAGFPFRALSRGMKRRLTVAAALIHSPRVIFLDEPTAGLDVPSARALQSLIRAINHDGTTVFLTTHNLAVAESLCDRILILVKGRVVFEGTATEIRQRVTKPGAVSVVLSGQVEKELLAKTCLAVKSATFIGDKWRLEVSDTHEAVAQLVSFARAQGLRLLEIDSATVSFEDAFMNILAVCSSLLF